MAHNKELRGVGSGCVIYLPFCSTSILSIGRESEKGVQGEKREINMNGPFTR